MSKFISRWFRPTITKYTVGFLFLLSALALFADFFSLYPPNQEFRDDFYRPPSVFHFQDSEGRYHLRPFIVPAFLVDAGQMEYRDGIPMFVRWFYPKGNQQDYIADTLSSESGILQIYDQNQKLLQTGSFLKEVDVNSGIFSAVIVFDLLQLQNVEQITIDTFTGERSVFNLRKNGGLSASLSPSSLWIVDRNGKRVDSFFPEIQKYPLRFFVRSWSYKMLGLFPANLHFMGVDSPGKLFLLGTDHAGRDLFSRILRGAQISLSISLFAVLLTSGIGVLLGGLAGYFGGKTDQGVMRLAEIILCIPTMYLILAVRSIFPQQLQDLYDKFHQWIAETYAWQKSPATYWTAVFLLIAWFSYAAYKKSKPQMIACTASIIVILFGNFAFETVFKPIEMIFPGTLQFSNEMVYVAIIGVLSFVGWGGMARVVRGMVLSLKEREFVTAARATGCSHFRILARHILPGTMSYVLVRATLLVPAYILAESTLSFLGVGIQEPAASWGNILSAAQDIRVLQDFTWILTPAVLLFATTLAFHVAGDTLRRAVQEESM